MAQYKVTRWMTASIPVVSRVEANSSEEAEEESSTAPYNYDYGNSVIGDIEDKPINAEVGLKYGLKPILIEHEHNKEHEEDGIEYAYDWEEILNIIERG